MYANLLNICKKMADDNSTCDSIAAGVQSLVLVRLSRASDGRMLRDVNTPSLFKVFAYTVPV